MKLASCKSALNPRCFFLFGFYSTDRFNAVVPVLVLLFVALWFILRGDLFYILCHFIIVFVSPFISAFRTFVRFGLVWICWFPLALDVWDGLRFVIVAHHFY